jgi:acetolactate synthase-1/2/3 large subunit
MVREFVKWDYELKSASQLEAVVDRALTIAMTHPRGPVYLTLPREILASPFDGAVLESQPRYDLPTFQPDPEKIEEAAGLLVKAKFPLIITSAVGRSAEAVRALVHLAEIGAIAVVSFNPEYWNFPVGHLCHQGYLHNGLLTEADVILVIECDVPWYPNTVKPKHSAYIIQAGIDPFYSNYPIRSFPSDITIQGDPAVILSQLAGALMRHPRRDERDIEARLTKLKMMHDAMLEKWRGVTNKMANDSPLDFNWISYQLNQNLPEDAVLINEYDMRLPQLTSERLLQYYGPRHASYLGWGLGAALGIKLGLPERPVIATVGDGAYLFSVPSSCHFISNAQSLPILVIIFNNQCWDTVKLATQTVHPDGWAARTGHYPLSELSPPGEYEKICEAFGGYGEKVESSEQVGPAIKRGLAAVMKEGRQAVLNMMCKHP